LPTSAGTIPNCRIVLCGTAGRLLQYHHPQILHHARRVPRYVWLAIDSY
jgi:hypothetical protein